MDKAKYPYAPGLSLDQARELAQKIKDQYGAQIAEAKNVENRIGCRNTYSDYLGV